MLQAQRVGRACTNARQQQPVARPAMLAGRAHLTSPALRSRPAPGTATFTQPKQQPKPVVHTQAAAGAGASATPAPQSSGGNSTFTQVRPATLRPARPYSPNLRPGQSCGVGLLPLRLQERLRRGAATLTGSVARAGDTRTCRPNSTRPCRCCQYLSRAASSNHRLHASPQPNTPTASCMASAALPPPSVP